MEVNSGTDVHLHPSEDVMLQQEAAAEEGHDYERSPHWNTHTGQFMKKCRKGHMLDRFMEDCITWDGLHIRAHQVCSFLPQEQGLTKKT